MKIKISADSTCDLSPELIARYNIGITPLPAQKATGMLSLTGAPNAEVPASGGALRLREGHGQALPDRGGERVGLLCVFQRGAR